jgi:peptidoglycan/LPS O-acetylase OafA/YrhL/lysophospholipase L1-like esterase
VHGSDRSRATPSPQRSANLDLLRSAALSFVVLSQLGLFFDWGHSPGFDRRDVAWANLGYWGVLVFFVQESVVLMGSMARAEPRVRACSGFVTFVVRRAFRLLPLSAVIVIVVSAFRLPVGHLDYGRFVPVSSRPVDVLANLLLVQNLANVEPLEAPLWSLPFEMQIALVLPAIFTFLRRGRGIYRALGLWVAAFAFGLAGQWHGVFVAAAYLPCFLAGVVAFTIGGKSRAWPYWLWPVAIGVVALVYLRVPLPPVGWACCLALGVLAPQFAEVPGASLRRACFYVARYAYGAYLWHFVLIWFAFVRLGGLPRAAQAAIFAILLGTVSVASYHLVEAPMIRRGAKLAARRALGSAPGNPVRVALAAAGLVALVAGLRVAAAKRPFVLGTTPTLRGSAVHLVGRFDTRHREGPRFAWPGSAIRVTFSGTGLDMRLRDDGTNFLSVVVDHGPVSVLGTLAGAHDYALASDLAPGPHEIDVTKRTEASIGVMQYLGVVPRDGALGDSADGAGRRLEYVGDSITCGYGDRGPSAACFFTPETEDETLGYAALAADALSARAVVVAYSGMGMYRDDLGSTAHPMPELFLRTLPDDPSSTWAFDQGAPDAVVIALGTNDYETGDPGPAFDHAYAEFLRDLRARYANAYLVATLSPMLSDAVPPGSGRRTSCAARILGAVRERNAAGDTRVAYLEFDEQTAEAGYGCDGHPSATTHRRMATKLADALRPLLGW